MPFSDCISRLICIYREGISLPHNFHENYATCSAIPMSKSIKMHLPFTKISSEARNPTNFTSYLQFWISNQRNSTMDDNSNMAPNPVP